MNKLQKIALIIQLLACQGLWSQTYTLSDTVFRNFLKATYPATINTSGDLVITEANKVIGTFNAPKKNLSNVDGIQHFIKLSKLQLPGNKLKTLPDISPIVNLNTLDLSENALVTLPSLSKMKRLKFLNLQKNALVMLPELAGADSLVNISAQYNSIDTVQDLSKFTMLKEVWLNYNKLRSAEPFENIKSLESLVIYKNEITVGHDFRKLSKLQELNISYNKLRIAPALGNNLNINIMYANDNAIDSITDSYVGCPNLDNVRLYNNPLTFSELIKFTTNSEYDTLIKLNPQDPFKVAFDLNVRENNIASLYTGIDNTTSGVSYEWYKNGSYYTTTASDALVFTAVKASDAGSYYCFVKHSDFHNFFIRTDTFNLSVSPCNDLSKISFEISDIECLKPGTVQVKDLNAEASKNTYILKSNVSEHIAMAQKGKFSELTEPSYTFTVKAFDGCEKTLSTPIRILQQECQEVLLYPDNEGNNSFYFEQVGEVIIYDKRGSIVKKLTIPGTWTGQGLKGHKVPSGFYVADINNGEKLIGITVLY